MRNRFSPAVVGLLVSSVISGTAQATVYSGRVNEAVVQSNNVGRTVYTTSKPSSVSYNTLTRAYTFTDASGNAYTLSPGELVSAQSIASYSVYRDTASGLTFKILKSGSGNPLIALNYVSYANWSKSVAPSSGYTSANQEDWVVYGQQTALTSMPRSGAATYSAILDGRYGDGSGLYRVSGNGGLTANFLAGTMNMFINPILTNQSTNASSHLGSMSGTGTISGGVFSGYDQSPDYNFSYAGNFYGPLAQEVGGTFSMNIGNGSGSGVFVGKQGALPAMDSPASPVTAPPPPPPPPSLTGRQVELNAAYKSGALVSAGTSSTGVSVGYDATTQTYVLRELGGTPAYSLTPGEIDSARSNDQFTVYRDGETGATFKMLNKGSANSLIALTYVSYAAWSRSTTPPTGADSATRTDYVVFGNQTPGASMPRTGSASYSAVLDGSYYTSSANYALGGTASFNADFAAGSIGFNLHPIASSGTTSVDMGNIGGTATISGSSFQALNQASGSSRVTVNGAFYGPDASEIGGTFSINGLTGSALPGFGGGAFVGKKQ